MINPPFPRTGPPVFAGGGANRWCESVNTKAGIVGACTGELLVSASQLKHIKTLDLSCLVWFQCCESVWWIRFDWSYILCWVDGSKMCQTLKKLLTHWDLWQMGAQVTNYFGQVETTICWFVLFLLLPSSVFWFGLNFKTHHWLLLWDLIHSWFVHICRDCGAPNGVQNT